MKRTKIVIRWPAGLHLRQASRLVTTARRFRSAIWLKGHNHIANARSILAVLMLGASFGTTLDLEIAGDDEDAAFSAITRVLEADGYGDTDAVRCPVAPPARAQR